MSMSSQDSGFAIALGFFLLAGTGLYLYTWYSISPRARRRAAR